MARAIFDAYDTGDYSLSQFVNYCNENSMFPRSGIAWQKGRMEKLLKNPFYSGFFRYDGGIHEGSHPAIFSIDRYNDRLKKLSANRNGSISNKKQHLFSKEISCPHCGRSYIAEKQNGAHNSGTYIYYRHRCPGQKTETRFKESDILFHTDRAVERARFSASFGEGLKELFRKPLEKKNKQHKKEMDYITAEISSLQTQKMRLYDLYALKGVRLEDVSEKLRDYDLRISAMERQLNALNQDNRKVFQRIIETLDYLKELPLAYLRAGSPTEKLKILKGMTEGLTLSPEGELRIKWKSPYSLIVRPEVEEAIEAGRLENLNRVPASTDPAVASAPASGHEKTRSLTRGKESGFGKVSLCAQKRT